MTRQDELQDLAVRLRSILIPLARRLRQPEGGLSPTEWSIIGTVDVHGPLPMSEIAEREHLSTAVVSRGVAKLAERDLVDVVESPTDRRSKRVAVSRSGAEWILETRARRNEWLATELARLSGAERDSLEEAIPALERLVVDG